MEEVRLREQEVGAGVWVAAGARKGGWQVGAMAGLSPHHALSVQELSKREVVAVGTWRYQQSWPGSCEQWQVHQRWTVWLGWV